MGGRNKKNVVFWNVGNPPMKIGESAKFFAVIFYFKCTKKRGSEIDHEQKSEMLSRKRGAQHPVNLAIYIFTSWICKNMKGTRDSCKCYQK